MKMKKFAAILLALIMVFALAACFSAANNTEGVAQKLADGLGADLYEIAVKDDVQKAIRLLKAAAAQGNDYAEHGNPYASQLLHSLQNNRN